tara:strand:- start:4475 stop:4717 length:243 start_codon:yes stop_codon:yes gene_type:complete
MQDVQHRDFCLQSNGVDEVYIVPTSGTLAKEMVWIHVEHKGGALIVTAFSNIGAVSGVHLGTIDKDGFLTEESSTQRSSA